MHLKYPSPNTASQSPSDTPGNEVLRANEQLDFALEGYVNLDAKPGVTPTPETAERAITAMFRYVRKISGRTGSPNGERDQETLSRVFIDIAQSKLTQKYQPRPAGVKPLLNRIIQRRAWKVSSRAAKERQRYYAMSLPIDAAARDMSPEQLIELEDLAARCAELLAETIAEPRAENPAEQGSFTATQRHRERKLQWQRIAHLFPDMPFRPKRRRGQVSRKALNALAATTPLKLSAPPEQ